MVVTTCIRDAEQTRIKEVATKVFKIMPQVLTEEPTSHMTECFLEAKWADAQTIVLKGLHEPGYKPRGACIFKTENGVPRHDACPMKHPVPSEEVKLFGRRTP